MAVRPPTAPDARPALLLLRLLLQIRAIALPELSVTQTSMLHKLVATAKSSVAQVLTQDGKMRTGYVVKQENFSPRLNAKMARHMSVRNAVTKSAGMASLI
jgi:hypothetical protein